MSWNGLLELLSILAVLENITAAKIAYYAFPQTPYPCLLSARNILLLHLPLVWVTFTTHSSDPSLTSLPSPPVPLVSVLRAYSFTAPTMPLLLLI